MERLTQTSSGYFKSAGRVVRSSRNVVLCLKSHNNKHERSVMPVGPPASSPPSGSLHRLLAFFWEKVHGKHAAQTPIRPTWEANQHRIKV